MVNLRYHLRSSPTALRPLARFLVVATDAIWPFGFFARNKKRDFRAPLPLLLVVRRFRGNDVAARRIDRRLVDDALANSVIDCVRLGELASRLMFASCPR